MPFRITPQAILRRSLYDMTNGYARLADAQVDISSTKRLRVFSDNAADAARALDLRTSIQRTLQSKSSIDDGARAADSQAELLEQVSDLIAQARTLGTSGASDGKTPSDLASIATEIDSILDQVLSIANQRLEGRFLFSGSQTSTRPFSVTRSFGKITNVSYDGDDLVRRVRLGPGETKEIELSGRQAFLDTDRTATILVGGTGLAGTIGAVDTMQGTATIQIAHTTTVVGDGAGTGGADTASGIARGLSTGLDTIVGAPGKHALVVADDGAGGRTIRLDDGTAVALTGTETDLALVNQNGDVVHVDLTGIVPGFTGKVDLTGNGTINVKGGPVQPLSFTDDFVLQDGSGRAVHLDTRGLLHGGETFVTFPGTRSIFDELIGLRDELNGTAGLSLDDRVARIQSRLGGLDAAQEGVLSGLSTLGARSASFQRVAESLGFFELSLTEKRGELEDTDIFEASIQLTQSQNAYAAALQAASKILTGPSLLNYL